MRVTTDFWVSALTRRVFSGGGFAAVVRRGATEAGAVFIVVRDRMGGVRLYGPAPQTIYDSSRPDERLFVVYDLEGEEALEARLGKELRFDSDIWVVDVEPGQDALETLVPIA